MNTISFEERVRRIVGLDLEPIKFKIVHDYRESGWTIDRVTQAESLYKRYLVLTVKHQDCLLVPTGDIDDFWHHHILDTAKYQRDCQYALGFFLHHFPYSGLLDDSDAKQQKANFERTQELWLREFGEPLSSVAADCKDCGPIFDCDGGGGDSEPTPTHNPNAEHPLGLTRRRPTLELLRQ